MREQNRAQAQGLCTYWLAMTSSLFLFLVHWAVWSALSWVIWVLPTLSSYKSEKAEFIHSNKSLTGCLWPEWSGHTVVRTQHRKSCKSATQCGKPYGRTREGVLSTRVTLRLEKCPCLPSLLFSASRNIASVTLPTFMQASSRMAMIPLCCCSTRSTMIWLLK